MVRRMALAGAAEPEAAGTPSLHSASRERNAGLHLPFFFHPLFSSGPQPWDGASNPQGRHSLFSYISLERPSQTHWVRLLGDFKSNQADSGDDTHCRGGWSKTLTMCSSRHRKPKESRELIHFCECALLPSTWGA